MAKFVQLVDGGHVFRTNDWNDEPDHWIVGYDYHNGPGCVACEDSWCMWCEDGRMEEQCWALKEPSLIPLFDLADVREAWKEDVK